MHFPPDSRSYDIVVTNGSGAVICEFQNLLVQRLSVQPPNIGRRLDLIFQPVSVPVTTKSRATYSERGRYKDEGVLFKVLDSLALMIILKSFQQQIVVGEDVGSLLSGCFAGLIEFAAVSAALLRVCPARFGKERRRNPAGYSR